MPQQASQAPTRFLESVWPAVTLQQSDSLIKRASMITGVQTASAWQLMRKTGRLLGAPAGGREAHDPSGVPFRPTSPRPMTRRRAMGKLLALTRYGLLRLWM